MFSEQEQERLSKEKVLLICDHNKRVFGQDEAISIFLEIKNIPKVTIKVFEFNPENYYKKEQKQLDNNINLDGLIATGEQTLVFDDAPFIKKVKEISFEENLTAKRGIFIIELMGSGLAARAIIKKGKLFARVRYTISGHEITILDENHDICQSEDTGIWIGGRFHQPN